MHTPEELEDFKMYATDKDIKLHRRKPYVGDSELLKAQIDTIYDLRKEFNITDPIKLGWQSMKDDDFEETSSNHQGTWINEKALQNRLITEENLQRTIISQRTKPKE